MKRILVFGLVVGLFAGQASAALYTLDVQAARQFTQLSANSAVYELQLVIDNPGGIGSTTYLEKAGFFGDGDITTPDAMYGDIMQYAVGFAGTMGFVSLAGADPLMWIGKANAGELSAGDTLWIPIANDNDDVYTYTAWYSTDNATTIVSGTPLQLAQDTTGSVSVVMGQVAPTHFGFTIQLTDADSVPDYFHTSVVPVPGAVLLGVLGLGAAGIRLRKRA